MSSSAFKLGSAIVQAIVQNPELTKNVSDIAETVKAASAAVAAGKAFVQSRKRRRISTGAVDVELTPRQTPGRSGSSSQSTQYQRARRALVANFGGQTSSSVNNQNNGNIMAATTRSRRTRGRRNLGGRRPMRWNRNTRRVAKRAFKANNRRRLRKLSKVPKKPISHVYKGISIVTQTANVLGGAVADNARVVYIGHCTSPETYMVYCSMMALCKKILQKAGFDIRAVTNSLPTGMVFTWGYYVDPRKTLTATFQSSTATETTLKAVGTKLQQEFYTAARTNPSMQPHELRLDYANNVYYLHTDKCELDIDCVSYLKIQNRTPNDDGGNAVDTNNINFIQGYQYFGNGTGAYYKDVRVATTADAYQPFLADHINGLIRKTDVPATQPSLLTPPASGKLFSHVTKTSKVTKFMPGQTRISILRYSRRMKYTTFCDSWLKNIAATNYLLSTVGKFSFFGLTKYIDDDTNNKPKFGYESETHIGMTVIKDSNPLTVQEYEPAVAN